MEIWLSFNNNAERLRLPILPPTFEVSVGNMNTRVNINEIGNINLIGKSDLREMTLESFFPAQDYYFVEYNGFPSPYSCIQMLENWRKSGKPIRLIITDTSINIAMAIENFSYREQDGTGDIYYSLGLAEYVFVGIKQGSEGYKFTSTSQGNTSVRSGNKSHGYVKENKRPSKEIPKKHTMKAGSNPVIVAKRATGNGANVRRLIDSGKISYTEAGAWSVTSVNARTLLDKDKANYAEVGLW